MKVTLPHLRELKIAGTPIVMVTAYDLPSGADRRRGRRRPRAGRRLGRQHRARPRPDLDRPRDDGRARHPDPRRQPGLRARDGDRRPAVHVLPGVRRGRRPERRPVRQGGRRRRASSSRAPGTSLAARRGDRRRRDPGDGPPRAHAADGHHAGRPQGPGPAVAPRQARCTTTRSPSRRPAASASCSSACPEAVSAAISKRLTIPTIGIGSGAGTDGQVLVLHDLLDMHGADTFQPKFVKHFAHIGDAMHEGVERVRRRGARGARSPLRSTPSRSRRRSSRPSRPRVEAGSAEDNILADW